MIASGRFSSRPPNQPRPGAREDGNLKSDAGTSASLRYDVLERSGEGTLFVVYRVRDKASHAYCALKALKGVYSRHAPFATAILNAARATSGLRHPQIATVREIGREEDTVFVVEDWLPGGTLEKRMRRAPFGSVEANSLAVQTLDGLSALHESGIAHGDLRPRQICFDAHGVAKLNDVGFWAAYPAAGMTMTDVQIESAYYQAPERWNGQSASPRADFYALGVVLYRAVTGRVPFDGTSPLAIAQRHCNHAPLRPQQFNPRCAPEMETLILRLLEKEPANRFASAREALAMIAPTHRPAPVRLTTPVSEITAAPSKEIRAPATTNHAADKTSNGNSRMESTPAATIVGSAPAIASGVLPPPAPVAAAASVAVAASPVAVPEVAPQKAVKAPIAERQTAARDAKPGDTKTVARPAIDPKKHRRREMLGAFLAFFWVIVAIGLLGGVLYGAYIFWMKEAPPEIKVPKYVGLNQADAKSLLENSGLKMRIGKETYNTKKPEGTVLSGEPPAGKLVRKGRVILVTVSRGEEPIRMVDFSELSLDQARAIIARHGMRLGQIAEQYHERVPKGFICGQFPEPGESFRRSEPINLVVSRGPLPSSTAPDPTELPPAPEAPSLPEIEPGAEDNSDTGSTPGVIADSSLITRGAIVSVALPSGGGPQEVKIVVRDAEGEYTAYQQTHEAGDVVDKPIQVLRPQGETALVRVYVGGRLLREIRV
jgi:serine/threonine-protein kinase